MRTEDAEADLELSCKHVGHLYPVLMDKHGNVIDGNHRLVADKNWPKLKLDHIKSKKELVLARLVSNVCRRNVPRTEKTQMLRELGEIHVQEGVSPGKIPHVVAEETGMSYRWVMEYLPDDLKERPGIGGPRPSLKSFEGTEPIDKGKVAGPATGNPRFLSMLLPKILEVKDYANTDFVHIVLERNFFAKIVRLANEVGTTPETIINNTLVSMLRKNADGNEPVPQDSLVLKELC
jgi:hypothetical protein